MITTTDRPLPASLPAEQMILGCILRTPDLMHDARNALDADSWSTERHKTVWGALCALYDAGQGIDRVVACEWLRDQKQLDRAGGVTGVLALEEGVPTTTHIEDYLRTVQDKAVLRRVIHAADNVAQRAYSGEPVREVLDAAGRLVTDLAPTEKGRGFLAAREVIDQAGAVKMLSPRRDKGIPLPWPWLNAILCGLHPQQSVIVAGDTSTGKTSVSLQVIAHAAYRGVGVAVFSLEMSSESLLLRMAIQQARVDKSRFDHDALNSDERQRLMTAMNEIYSLPIYFDDTAAVTMAGIQAGLRKLNMRHSFGLVLVDYLQLIRGSGRFESRNQEVGGNARALKLIAKEFNVPVICPSQLKRKTPETEPTLNDLRDSGEIEEHADVVVFVHPTKAPAEIKPAKLIVAKQREGPRDVWRNMQFFSQFQRFEETCDD